MVFRAVNKYNSTMPYISEKYLPFYLEGRSFGKLLKHHLDADDLVDLILKTSGKALHVVLRESCMQAASKLETGKVKNVWIVEHDDEIKAAGGDSAAAYEVWVAGRVDELVYATETEVIDAMNERVGGGSEDEDEDEEEDDNDDDEEEDDNDDDDEEEDE